MKHDVYDEFDFIMQRVHLKMGEVYELGYKPTVLVVSRDIHYRVLSSDKAHRYHSMLSSDPMTQIFGLKIHVSSMLPKGSFMVLTAEELDVILRYRDILNEGLCTLEPLDANFNLGKYNKGLMNHKTNLLEGFDG